jgi:hypothetical protein
MMRENQTPVPSADVFLSSLLARPAWLRLAGVLAMMVVVWLLIAWAVSLP